MSERLAHGAHTREAQVGPDEQCGGVTITVKDALQWGSDWMHYANEMEAAGAKIIAELRAQVASLEQHALRAETEREIYRLLAGQAPDKEQAHVLH